MAEDCPDPGILVNCPQCGAVLTFVATKPGDAVYLYRCDRDGLFILTVTDPTPVPVRRSLIGRTIR
jgi:hypothetical protein